MLYKQHSSSMSGAAIINRVPALLPGFLGTYTGRGPAEQPPSPSQSFTSEFILQVRPSGWTRRIMWGVAFIAMTGSCFTMGVLWLLYALIRPMDLKSKNTAKDMKSGLSDEEVSSEEGASDLATGAFSAHYGETLPLCCGAGGASALSLSDIQCVGMLLGCATVDELVLQWSVPMKNAGARQGTWTARVRRMGLSQQMAGVLSCRR